MSLIADVLSHLVKHTVGLTPQITTRELQIAAHQLAQDRRSQETAALAMFCRYFTLAYQNSNYNVQSNGERWLLQQLVPFQLRVIFDVGANIGDWAFMAHTYHPSASIHAFEIVPHTYEKLIHRMPANEGWFHPNPFGLGASPGQVVMNYFEGADTLSTFTEYPHGPATKISCPIQVGDDYVASKGLTRIDFLKMDVEGAEHLVLQGFQKTLDREAVDLIQFEYGKVQILTHFLLADYYRLFESKGFAVGKLFPEGVKFRPYSLDDEDFIGPNFIACRKTRTDLIDALQWR